MHDYLVTELEPLTGTELIQDHLELTADPASPLNTPELFSLITQALQLECGQMWLPDIKSCRVLIDEVEQELERLANKNVYLQSI